MSRKIRLLGLLALFCALVTSAQGQAGLEIAQLTGNFYVYTTYRPIDGKPFPSNSLYVVTDGGVVMIDTPWDTMQLDPLLDSIETRHHKKVVMCISTHFHDDRTAGLEKLRQKGVKTYCSTLTQALAGKEGNELAAYTFSRDTIFHIGELAFNTFYPGAGHTADNIVVWFPQEKVLYGGCLVKSTEARGLGNLADANTAEWPKSIERLIRAYPDARYIIPGHQGWQSTAALQHTLDLLKAGK